MLLEEERPILPEGERPTLPEGKPPAAAQAAPPAAPAASPNAPNTREELAVKFEQLAARARAAGISPLQAMAQTYVKRGMAVLDGILSALEEAPNKTPADTEKKV